MEKEEKSNSKEEEQKKGQKEKEKKESTEKNKKENSSQESLDILLEEEIKKHPMKMQRILSNNFGPSLDKREFTPILNLEKDLPKEEKKQESTKEEENFDYLIKTEEKKQNYQKSNDFEIPTNSSKNLSQEEMMKVKQKNLYRSREELSSELAFVEKQAKTMYTKPEKVDFNELPNEDKKTVENSFEKMKENYR